MGNNKKMIGLVVAVIIAILGIGYSMFRTDDGPELSPQGNTISFTGSELKEEKNGQVIWQVKADAVDIDPKTKGVTVKQMVATFNRDGQSLTVTAPMGTVSGDRKRMELKGGVKAVNTEGAIFATDEVVFDNEKKVFVSSTPFTYTDKDTSISGDSLEADMVLERVTAKGNAKLIRK